MSLIIFCLCGKKKRLTFDIDQEDGDSSDNYPDDLSHGQVFFPDNYGQQGGQQDPADCFHREEDRSREVFESLNKRPGSQHIEESHQQTDFGFG